jgi:DNA topoisomerase-3
VLYRDGPKACEFRWNRGRLYDAAVAGMLHELCAGSPLATVTSVEGARKSKWAPVPLSTLEMQKRGSQASVGGCRCRKAGRKGGARA